MSLIPTLLIIVVCESVLSPPALARGYPTDIIKVATAELFDAVNAVRESTEQNPRLARDAERAILTPKFDLERTCRWGLEGTGATRTRPSKPGWWTTFGCFWSGPMRAR